MKQISTLVGLALFCFVAGAQEKLDNSKDAQNARVHFSRSLSLEETFDLEDAAVLVTQIEHSFSFADHHFVGFYPVPEDSSLEDIRSGWQEAYNIFLEDMIQSTARELEGEFLPSNEFTQHSILVAELRNAQAEIGRAPLRVDSITVSGRPDNIEAVQTASPWANSVELTSSNPRSQGLYVTTPQTILPTLPSSNTWVPKRGTVTTAPSAAGGRYLYTSMIWENVAGFKTWPNSTYEHDFFLNNDPNSKLGRGTYLDRSESLDHIPTVTYATSSLPSPYLDTRLNDPSTEIAYTIGSANAAAITTNTSYTNYIQTKNGDTNTDNGKLIAQLGHRSPSWWYSVWSSYGDAWERLSLGDWPIPVPSSYNWQH